jgi:hypothetical protein
MDDAVKELKRLQGVVARLAQNAGIDQSNPQRGINAGATPSVKNPVDQKLSSLADVQIYNVADKQVLTWSQQGQKWLPVTPLPGGAFAVRPEISGFSDALGYGFAEANPGDPFAIYMFGSTSLNPNGAGYFRIGGSEGSAETDGHVYIGNYTEGHFADGHAGRLAIEATEQMVTATPAYEVGCELAGDARSTYLQMDVSYAGMTAYGTGAYSEVVVRADGVSIKGAYLTVPVCTTADRPTAPRNSSHVYDDTLKKPIWYDFDGAVWRDAAGTVV